MQDFRAFDRHRGIGDVIGGEALDREVFIRRIIEMENASIHEVRKINRIHPREHGVLFRGQLLKRVAAAFFDVSDEHRHPLGDDATAMEGDLRTGGPEVFGMFQRDIGDDG